MRAQKFAKTIGELSNLNATKCHTKERKTKGEKKEKKEKKKKRKKEKNMNTKQTNTQFINQM